MRFPLISSRNYSTNSAAGGRHSNLHNNPYLDQVSSKIIELLPTLSPVVLEFALNFLMKNRRTKIIKELNLSSLPLALRSGGSGPTDPEAEGSAIIYHLCFLLQTLT